MTASRHSRNGNGGAGVVRTANRHSRNGNGGAGVVLAFLPVVEHDVQVHAAHAHRPVRRPVLQRLVVDDVDDGHGADAVVLRDGLHQRLVPT